MVSIGQEFWIVATSKGKLEDPGRAIMSTGRFTQALPFTVPTSLSFGSFDNLIRLTDELQKFDGTLDGIVHRLERQLIEIDPAAKFVVKSQRQEKPLADYIGGWGWDESKYPLSRSISDTVNFLMQMATKEDDAVRNKTAQFNEAKTLRSNLALKEGANLLAKDLIDVLTPTAVKMGKGEHDDFIYTEHLTTVVVILTKGQETEFLPAYLTFDDKVVPHTAKKFEGIVDKDGNTVWRVVMFKSAVEPFKKACRDHKFAARDFEYSEEAYTKLSQSRDKAEAECKRLYEMVKSLYTASWSDVFCAWMHVKAMRVFVESVLRFGMPPNFMAAVVVPKSGSQAAARTALAKVLEVSGPAADADDGEEFFPYVSFSFVPLNASRV